MALCDVLIENDSDCYIGDYVDANGPCLVTKLDVDSEGKLYYYLLYMDYNYYAYYIDHSY